MNLMYITNDVQVASIVESSGVDTIFIDLEIMGKEDRQKNMDTVKSRHSFDDIYKVKKVLKSAELLVRINPLNNNTAAEIDCAVNGGADYVMLPMFKTCNEVDTFLKAVDRRSKTILLLETKEAENIIKDILKIDGFDEIFIGLNDLHLSKNKSFMFELLTDGTVENLTKKIKKKGKPFGFGGIASLGSGILPAENILAEHVRLGSSRVILSRAFCNTALFNDFAGLSNYFTLNIAEIRRYLNDIKSCGKEFFDENKRILRKKIEGIVSKR